MDSSEPDDLHHEGGWPASGSAAAQKPDQIGARAQGAQGALDAEAKTSTQSWLGKQYEKHPVVVTLGALGLVACLPSTLQRLAFVCDPMLKEAHTIMERDHARIFVHRITQSPEVLSMFRNQASRTFSRAANRMLLDKVEKEGRMPNPFMVLKIIFQEQVQDEKGGPVNGKAIIEGVDWPAWMEKWAYENREMKRRYNEDFHTASIAYRAASAMAWKNKAKPDESGGK